MAIVFSDELKQLKKELFALGRIGPNEVEHIQAHCGDIDREEADFLYYLKDAMPPERVTEEFYDYFVDSITSFLLEDEESPGEIDDSEAKWLRAKIMMKGRTDCYDKRLLENLKRKSVTFPELLSFRSRGVHLFEFVLFGQRFVTLLAVIGAMLASIVTFVTSSMKVCEGILYAFDIIRKGNHVEGSRQVVYFVEAIDGYLFATILIIFSTGIYELFINKIDPVSLKCDNRPNWLKIKSIDDLKDRLAKVILMILVVSFFEHSIQISYDEMTDLLFLALGTVLMSGSLYLAHKH